MSTNISKMSYTSKDFATIYGELLDLANQLTNKWDPSQSNESDPGVVLLKEAAFVGDHLNYNIDKNTLEAFLPSATQDRSTRNILEMNGYVPEYYISATGDVTIKWTFDESSDESNESFTIPALTLVVTDEDGAISYTQVEDISITESGVPSSGKFIEGTLQELVLNDNSTVTLDNLDKNNRIYLPDAMVAQNGVYIKNVTSTDYSGYWERDNYLLTRPNESRVYKLDYDSVKGLPYIEFPSDIANIIGDGLSIKYIATSGVNGNISAGKLVNIASPDSFVDAAGNTRSTDNFTLSNTGSISNGKDPETIDQMYQSFKRVVGTFDTLVTSKDYSNAIYSLKDSYDNPYVSNAYATDRRTDYNKSANVITYDMYKEFFENISLKKCTLVFRGVGQAPTEFTPAKGDLFYVTTPTVGSAYVANTLYYYNGVQWSIVDSNAINLNDFAILTEAMTPYDLVIYAFTAFSLSEFNTKSPSTALNNSFTPASSETYSLIKSELADVKCISHNYKSLDSTDIFCFKNYAPLNVTIQPFNKVTKAERTEIINNVYKALTENFNAREINFGEELDFDKVHSVIVNADERINDAYVSSIEYEPYAMLANGYEYPLTNTMSNSSYTYLVDMIAKNVLAGRVCLFNFDEDFTYKYGQSSATIYNDISSITTEIPIEITTPTTTTTVTRSDSVTSNITVACTISSGVASNGNVNYIFNAPNYTESGVRQGLTKGSSYTLVGDDYLTLVVTENGLSTTTTYQSSSTVTYTVTNNLEEMASQPQGYITTLANLQTSGELLSKGYLTVVQNTSTVVTTGSDQNLNYTLRDNEYIQIISPNYYEDSTYGAYVYYRYEDSNSNTIPADTIYTLSGSQKIILQYTADGITSTDRLVSGDVIKSSISLTPATSSTTGTTKQYIENGQTKTASFIQLTSNQSISKMAQYETILDNSYVMCYWITDNISNGKMKLFDTNQTVKILGNNEYFIYANSTMDEIMILGSGTKITRNVLDDHDWSIEKTDLSISSIAENGTSASINWKAMNFSTYPIAIDEMSITTLASGDNIVISGWAAPSSSGDWVIDNTWQDIYATIVYTSNSTVTTLQPVPSFYQIRSRLDLSMSPTTYQTLIATDLGSEGLANVQKINIKYGNALATISGDADGVRVQASQELDLVGGETINLSDIIDLGITLNMYKYKTTDITLTKTVGSEGTTTTVSKGELGYVATLGSSETGKLTLPFHYDPYYSTGVKRFYLLPVYVEGDEVPIVAQVKTSGESVVKIREFNSGSDWTVTSEEDHSYISFYGSGMTYIEVGQELVDGTELDANELQLELTWDCSLKTEWNSYEVIIVDEYFSIKGVSISEDEYNLLNETVSLSGATSTQVCGRIKELIAGSDKPSLKPYYTYKPENSMAIETPDFSNSNILWDVNNVANIMSIPQIDISNSNIDISTSMRNY